MSRLRPMDVTCYLLMTFFELLLQLCTLMYVEWPSLYAWSIVAKIKGICNFTFMVHNSAIISDSSDLDIYLG